MFCYGETSSKAVAEENMGHSTYVRYSEVMDNEFFGSSQRVLDALEALKKDMIAAYPAGSVK